MSLKQEDRRIRKTKKLLKESLIELMNEKKVKDITIKDITERADLNRGTFYLHYLDIYDLLSQIEDEIITNLTALLKTFNETQTLSSYELLEQLFNYLYENKEIFRVLLYTNSDTQFLNKLQTLIKTMGLYTLQNVYKDSPPIVYTYFLSFISSGVIGMVEHWFENGMTLTPSEMASIVDQMITKSAENFMST